jgi:conserved hypothetical protein TIGR02688
MVNQDELSAKLRYYYPEYVVDKGIANMQDIRRVPKFVSEHLLTKISYESDKKTFNEKLMKIVELINTLYPEAKDRDVILDKVIIKGQEHKIIDEVKVEVDEKHEIRKSVLPSLNLRNVMILDSVVDGNPQLLSTGIWGMATIRYTEPLIDEKGKKLTLPVVIEKFNPFHVSSINMNEFVNNREKFTTEEWMDVLINTIGLNPQIYTQRQKLLLISRFIPLLENNINLMEFGPRATGKTYFYRNISFYTRIISGGRMTPAQLFYNIARRTVGEIGMKDSIVFDEIARLKFSDPSEMMGKLKDYMVDGHFERGPKKGTSLCSLIFMGNIDIRPTESGYIPIEDINYKLPDFMRNDTAFLDRIHGVLPGWEILKIKKSEVHLSRNYGFSVDFFSEILHELRKVDFTPVIRSLVKLENVTIRDEIGVYRLAAGLTKILFPDKNFSNGDLKMVIDIVVEYRQMMVNLLHKMAPGEFERKNILYEITNDLEV